jgi:hypothetical protein
VAAEYFSVRRLMTKVSLSTSRRDPVRGMSWRMTEAVSTPSKLIKIAYLQK